MISILAIIISSIVIICCVGNIVATECAARQSLRALGTYTIKIKTDPDFTMKQFGIDIREYENPNAALEWQNGNWSPELIVFDRDFVSVSLSRGERRKSAERLLGGEGHGRDRFNGCKERVKSG